MALALGVLVPTQTGVNSLLAKLLGNPIPASLISFATGTLALVAYALFAKVAWPVSETLVRGPFWIYLGGVMGALIVTGGILLAPRLGAANLFALLIAGQMLASLVFDHFGLLGFPQQPVTPGRCLGAALLLVAVLMIRRQ